MQKKKSLSLNFWAITLTFIVLLLLGIVFEMVSLDGLMGSQRFKKKSGYTYKKKINSLLIVSNLQNSFDFEKYNESPELLFEHTKQLFKDDPQEAKIPTKVALVEIEGKRYIAKKYYRVNFLHWTKLFPVRRSKAYKSCYYADLFSQRGIATPKPQLLIEKRVGPFWITGYTLHEYIDGITASRYFSKDSPFKEDWEETLRDIKMLADALGQLHLTHKDFHLENILIERGKPILIDLDRIHRYYFPYAIKCFFHQRFPYIFKLSSLRKKDLKKFSKSLKKQEEPEVTSLSMEIFELPI